MVYITKKSLTRRTLLRGMGAAVTLPLLDAMIPAATALNKTPAKAAKRLGYIFLPMGADMSRWIPDTGVELNQLSYILSSLEPFKDELTVLTNCEIQNAYPGSHATSNSSFLSCARAKLTESNDYYLGTTVDQIAAKHIGQHTQLPSIEMAMDLLQTVGQCDNGYACVYQNNLSWSSPTTPLPSEAHPRIVFEMLFGAGGSLKERQAALRKRASLLDSVTKEIRRLNRSLGPDDRLKVDEYMNSIREVERRIQKAEADAKNNPLPDLDRPMGVPASYADHARLMFDLHVLALQGDVTRVTSFQLARETSTRTYPETGVSESHHPLSHHGNDPKKIAKMAKINQFHVSLFAHFLERLKATPEGNSNLLDNSVYLFGSGMGDPNKHDHSNLPILVAGGASYGIKGRKHIKYDKPKPLASLHLTLLQLAGIPMTSFMDSDGPISELFT